MEKLISFAGMLILIGVAFLMSDNKRRIRPRILILGVLLQVFFAFIILPNSPLNTWIKSASGLERAPGEWFFDKMNDVVIRLLGFAEEGGRFLFGNLVNNNLPLGVGEPGNGPVAAAAGQVAVAGAYFAFNVLPTIIFFSALMGVLYHLGIMQKIVAFFSKIMEKTLGTSGAETLSASANIFVGQTEAPLVVRPYVSSMTISELMVVMVGGFATVAGGVMAAYVGMLKDYFPSIAGHLISASIMSAPAAIVIAKLMIPETGDPVTKGGIKIKLPKTNVNVIDAAASGAGTGLQLALNVGAMLLAFIALIAMLNFLISLAGDGLDLLLGNDPNRITFAASAPSAGPGDFIEVTREGESLGSWRIAEVRAGEFWLATEIKEEFSDCSYRILSSASGVVIASGTGASGDPGFSLSLELILGWVFAPVAWIMGVPWADCRVIGRLLGEKMALNEFVAYFNLTQVLAQAKAGLRPELAQRSVIIATYALCGFANFSSIAIQIGGIGGIAPDRRHDLARIGFRAMIGGTLAAFMTGTIAGLFV